MQATAARTPVVLLGVLLVFTISLAGCHEAALQGDITVILVEGTWKGHLVNGTAPEGVAVCDRLPSWSLTENDELLLWASEDTRDELQGPQGTGKGAVVLYEIREDTPFSVACGPIGYTFLSPGEAHDIVVLDAETDAQARIQVQRDADGAPYRADGTPLEKASPLKIRHNTTGNGTFEGEPVGIDFALNATALHYGDLRVARITWHEP